MLELFLKELKIVFNEKYQFPKSQKKHMDLLKTIFTMLNMVFFIVFVVVIFHI